MDIISFTWNELLLSKIMWLNIYVILIGNHKNTLLCSHLVTNQFLIGLKVFQFAQFINFQQKIFMKIQYYLQYSINNMRKTILLHITLFMVLQSTLSQNTQFNSVIDSYAQCCGTNWIYSLDRTWWMRPAYNSLASPNGFPDQETLIGSISFELNIWRQYFNYFMGIHQYTCQEYQVMNHQVPIVYPGVSYPELNSWCDLISDLNHPFKYLTHQLNTYKTNTNFNLFLAATPFTDQPSYQTTINLISAIKNSQCKVSVTIYVVRWWFFWPFKRMLQTQNLATESQIADIESSARSLFRQLSLDQQGQATQYTSNERLLLFQRFDQSSIRKIGNEIQNAGAEFKIEFIQNHDSLKQALYLQIIQQSEITP